TAIKAPSSATDARTWPHRTSRTASQQTRRSARPPATHSNADKTDALEPTPTRRAGSRCPLASPAAYASPSPCADSTNKVCGYHESFCFTNLNLHNGLLLSLVRFRSQAPKEGHLRGKMSGTKRLFDLIVP